MTTENIVGIAAGTLTSMSLLPQLLKIIKEKKGEDVSYIMLGILLLGLGGWVYYGTLKNDLPIIITNSFAILINLLIMLFKKLYEKNTST